MSILEEIATVVVRLEEEPSDLLPVALLDQLHVPQRALRLPDHLRRHSLRKLRSTRDGTRSPASSPSCSPASPALDHDTAPPLAARSPC